MNADDARIITETAQRGWYVLGTGIGSGGMAEFNTLTAGWKLYILSVHLAAGKHSIRAIDDDAAIAAFKQLFVPEAFDRGVIVEKIVEYRKVK